MEEEKAQTRTRRGIFPVLWFCQCLVKFLWPQQLHTIEFDYVMPDALGNTSAAWLSSQHTLCSRLLLVPHQETEQWDSYKRDQDAEYAKPPTKVYLFVKSFGCLGTSESSDDIRRCGEGVRQSSIPEGRAICCDYIRCIYHTIETNRIEDLTLSSESNVRVILHGQSIPVQQRRFERCDM